MAGDEAVAAGIEDHGQRIDDRDGVEKRLGEDIPDGGDVAIFDVDGAEEEGDAESEGVELEDEERNEQPGPAGSDAVKEGEENEDAEVDGEVDEGGGGGGDDDNVFREADLAQEVATEDDGLDALPGTFGEEVPEDSAGQEIDGVVRDVAADAEEFREDDIEDGKHQKWAQNCPKIA